jgi:GNAT superfamily N-acetyltransferase
MLTIKPLTIAQFFDDPAAAELLAEYADECALAGLPSPEPHRQIYEVLERTGAVTLLAAYEDGGPLVGFCALLVSMNPHYSQILGATESLFVAKAHRKTGAGLRLLREAEAQARAKGALGLLVSAPFGGDLAAVLNSRHGWDRTNIVFCKVL